MKRIFMLLMFAGFLSSCSNEVLENNSDLEDVLVESRGIYNDSYFDWDRIKEIPYKTNTSSGSLSLPWAAGNFQAAGIPSQWIDQNAGGTPTTSRLYARENGWNLVYSNLNNKTQNNKYFALYNEKIGLLRFFYYVISGTFTEGTTNTFVALNIPNGTTSLLNFYGTIAEPISAPKTSPAIANSFKSSFDGKGGVTGVGFRPDTWYGFEIECAYDPNINNKTKMTFESAFYSTNLTFSNGTAETTGNITGVITGTSSNMSSISLTNMFNGASNNNNVNFAINNTLDIASNLGSKIDAGIAKKDNFFTGLWNNLKSGITSGVSAGAKAGIKSIFDGGASAVTSSLKGLLTSFLGGGANNSISKVDLKLQATSTIKVTSSTQLNGPTLSQTPLPGSLTTDVPLYNKPLGVWNLSQNPSVTVDMDNYSTIPQTVDGTYTTYSYSVAKPQVVVNPTSNMSIKNISWTLILQDNSPFPYIKNLEPFTILNGVNYRIAGTGISTDEFGSRGSLMFAQAKLNNAKPYIYVSLELTDKATGKSYFYSKYFNIGKITQGRVRNFVDNKIGNGNSSSGGGKFPPMEVL